MRTIAFYLPQFHPTPENDAWWGQGFTEWRNVVQARSLFRGHHQPQFPSELGYYDLRVPETRAAQAELARAYGIDGFCYYHYWFKGRRLLDRPFREVLTSGQPDFPFCLCWANESWTRAWDGATGVCLLEQQYSPEDDAAHMEWLAHAFRDPRYIRYQNKPVFLVYRAANMPDPCRTTEVWRETAHRLGIGELFLCRVESNFAEERGDPRPLGFDAAVEFQPDALNFGPKLRRGTMWEWAARLHLSSWAYQVHNVFDYQTVMQRMLGKPRPPYRWFRSVTPGFDNSPRRRVRAFILRGSSPALYEHWLRELVLQARNSREPEELVFINAWNEWAEGNHLEPDTRFGRAYLEATRRALAVSQERVS